MELLERMRMSDNKGDGRKKPRQLNSGTKDNMMWLRGARETKGAKQITAELQNDGLVKISMLATEVNGRGVT